MGEQFVLNPLLATKLYIPPARPDLVPRPRLLEELDAAFGRRLTLISAPAGFGKTTLLAQWIEHARALAGLKGDTVPLPGHGEAARAVSIGWLSLDEGDNDPVRFLSYVRAACLRAEPGPGEGTRVRTAPDETRPAQRPALEEMQVGLLNDLAALTGPLMLVLDDYHLVTSQAVHDVIAFLLEHLPEAVHLVIATRADPPLPLARLRARAQLVELRQAELTFTAEEAAGFLRDSHGLALADSDVAALSARTEGWITGLQLAAVSLQGRDREQAARFVRSFTGSSRHVLDYLIDEVLRYQPQPVQDFLVQTSILERLAAPLCDAVLRLSGPGITPVPEGSQPMLDYLDRSNLFVVPLDDRREWYRYHQLFRDLLQRRLRQERAEAVVELHRRASNWFQAAGLVGEAVSHALAAGDVDRAGVMILAAAENALAHSRVATLLRWIEALPEGAVRDRPMLGIYRAAAMLLDGRPLGPVELSLRQVAGVDVEGRYGGERAAVQSFIATYQGDGTLAASLARQALQRLRPESVFLRSIMADILGLADMLAGDLAAAARTLEQASTTSLAAGDILGGVAALCNLAGLYMIQGHLRRAAGLYGRALELATDADGRRLPVAGKALLGLGSVLRQWDRLEEAGDMLEEGLALMAQYSSLGATVGYLSLADIRQAQGELEAAERLLAEAERIASVFDTSDVEDHLVAARRARLSLARGDVEAAERWATGRQLEAEGNRQRLRDEGRTGSPLYDVHASEYVILARLYLAQQRPAEALALADELQPVAERNSRLRRQIELLVLRALCLAALGRRDGARAAVTRALTLAAPEGYVSVFTDEGAVIFDLVSEVAEDESAGPASEAAKRVLGGRWAAQAALPLRPEAEPDRSANLSSSSSPEQLTEREREILRLLATHLSTPEIAARLVVSANTVRFHVKNIYGKLGVHDRSEALARAAELKLL